MPEKTTMEEIKNQWKKLWEERLDDKVRAERVATNDYSFLFVEKGTIIQATKDYKALNLREIVDQHNLINSNRYISPNPNIGGWSKFIKTKIFHKSKRNKKRNNFYHSKADNNQPSKQGGRGWLHT
jgi:hypothetical protein